MADAAAARAQRRRRMGAGMGLVRLIAANARLFTGGSERSPGSSPVATPRPACRSTFTAAPKSKPSATTHRLCRAARRNRHQPRPDRADQRRTAPRIGHPLHRIRPERRRPNALEHAARHPRRPRNRRLRRLPIMPSVYAHADNFVDKVDPISNRGGFNKSEAREEDFRHHRRADRVFVHRPARRAPRHACGDSRFAAGRGAGCETWAVSVRSKGSDPAGVGVAKRARRPAGSNCSGSWTREFREEYQTLREEAAGK